VLRRYGVNLAQDCWTLNAVGCCPYDKDGAPRNPTEQEVGYCQPRVWRHIKRLKPTAIILFGKLAVHSFVLNRYVGDDNGIRGINRWRGYCIPDQETGAWVCPLYHPSYVLRSLEDRNPEIVVETLFEQDLERALHYALDVPVPKFPDPKDHMELITDPEQIELTLQKIDLEASLVTLDWETDRLRAYGRGSRIVSFSMAWDWDKVISCPFPTRKSEQVTLKRVLVNSGIHKTAHNMPFEQMWAWAKLGVTINPWLLCTMNGVHVLDNRPRSTSLKFQTYVNFGVPDYDSHMKQWLKASSEEDKAHGANARNHILKLAETEAGMRTLLTYGAYDGLYEHWLARKMIEGGLV
jgi:uracil-DNA glycosylase family 4